MHGPQLTSPANAPLQLRLFGVPRVLHHGNALRFGSRKAITVLALLAIEGPMRRESLAQWLWPEADAASARRNLRRDLFRLRELELPLEESADGLLALGTTWSVDWTEFRRARAAGDEASALAWAHGEPLQGLDGVAGARVDEWLSVQRGQLASECHQARLAHAGERQRHGDADTALSLYRQVLAEQPADEQALQAAMALLAARGQRSAALALFESARLWLQRELAVAPTPALQAQADALVQAHGVQARLPGLLVGATAGAVSPTSAAAGRAPVIAAAGAEPGRMAANAAAAHLNTFERLPFVGRGSEREALQSAWREGRAAYVSGVPGVGKTRLACECAAAAGAWLRLSCAPLDEELPYASAVQALRTLQASAPEAALPAWVRRELAPLMPELGAAPEAQAGAAARQRLHAAFDHALRLLLRENFDAVVVDDWHWCDADSAELLTALPQQSRFADAPHGEAHWVFVYRSGWLRGAPGEALQHALASGSALQLELEGLDAAATQQLLSSWASQTAQGMHPAADATLGQRLQQATAGNPFHIVETLRHLAAQGSPHEPRAALPLPGSVRDTVLLRVRALGDAARRMLEAASLLDGAFDVALLEGHSSASADEVVATLEAATAARLLVADERGQHHFSHDLVRQCLAESVSPARRQLLHGRWAERLGERQAAPALRALHLERAGQGREAVALRLQAGDAALRVNAWDDALRQYQRALAQPATPEQQVQVHLTLWRLHQRRADSAQASAAVAAAVSASERTDAATRLRARLACVDQWCATDRVADALALLEALQADLAQAVPALRARALAAAARCHSLRGHYELALQEELRGVAMLEGQPDALHQLATLLDDAGRTAMRHGRFEQAAQLARRAAATFEANADMGSMAQALVLLGVAHLHHNNDREAAFATFERARAAAASSGHVPAQRGAILNLVKLHTDRMQTDAALALVQEGAALAPTYEHAAAEQGFEQARYFVHYLRGDAAAAHAAAQRLLAQARRITDRAVLLGSLTMVVDLYLHAGQLSHAEALLDEADAICAGIDEPASRLSLAVRRAWWHLWSGDVPAAMRALPAPDAPGMADVRAVLAWVGAAAALASQRQDEAGTWLALVNIDDELATDYLSMLLAQHLLVAHARGEAGDAHAQHARQRALALLQAQQVPAFERRHLEAALEGRALQRLCNADA